MLVFDALVRISCSLFLIFTDPVLSSDLSRAATLLNSSFISSLEISDRASVTSDLYDLGKFDLEILNEYSIADADI